MKPRGRIGESGVGSLLRALLTRRLSNFANSIRFRGRVAVYIASIRRCSLVTVFISVRRTACLGSILPCFSASAQSFHAERLFFVRSLTLLACLVCSESSPMKRLSPSVDRLYQSIERGCVSSVRSTTRHHTHRTASVS